MMFGPPVDSIKSLDLDLNTWECYEADIGRPPAFPLYISINGREIIESLYGYLPGRIIFPTHSGSDKLFRPDLMDVVCPQDVILCRWNESYRGSDAVPFRSTWRENAAVLKEVGDSVYAVMTGQWNVETGFVTELPDDRDVARTESVRRCREFIKLSGSRLREVGCRPAFGVIIDQILLDAYWAENTLGEDQTVLATLLDLDALVICFLGWMFWSTYGHGMAAQTQSRASHDPDGKMIGLRELDKQPHAKLTAWLNRIEAWGGVNYLVGLHHEYDKAMFKGGFNAGVIGELPFNVQKSVQQAEFGELFGERGSILRSRKVR